MKCVAALSTDETSDAAMRGVVDRAARDWAGAPADLALVFASMHHAEALGRIAGEVVRKGLGRHVLGCTGDAIAGGDREIEEAPALSLWAIRTPGLELALRRFDRDDEDLDDWAAGAAGAILLGDPFSFAADRFLGRLQESAPGLPVVGGMASGGAQPGQHRLILDGQVHDDGAVAVAFRGPLRMRTIVSQGCRPIGRPMIVTKSERNLIRELGRRPAVDVLRELFETLPPDEQHRVQQGLHIGRVINEYQERFQRGDFLVRNVIGADDEGGIAITDVVRVGQTVQFHVRDAETADEDLRTLLERAHREQAGAEVVGALLFTCNGRGSRLFAEPDHDISALRRVFGPIAAAGFFAMGEIGPVGGQNFLHGYTASIALFEEM
jgi:small ligand-binding sensory domain FIST